VLSPADRELAISTIRRHAGPLVGLHALHDDDLRALAQASGRAAVLAKMDRTLMAELHHQPRPPAFTPRSRTFALVFLLCTLLTLAVCAGTFGRILL